MELNCFLPSLKQLNAFDICKILGTLYVDSRMDNLIYLRDDQEVIRNSLP